MLRTSQGSINRDLIYLTSPTKKAGLFAANKVILNVFCVGWPATILRLTHPLFWLWSKEWGLRPFCKYVGRIAIEFKAYSRSQCICIDICTNSLLLLGLICTNGRKSLYILGKTGLVGKMPIVGRMNPESFLDSTCIAAIGLNHLMDHLLD